MKLLVIIIRYNYIIFLYHQQSKYNWILIFIPIFPGDTSDLYFLLSLFGVPLPLPPGIPNVKQEVTQ